jgi:serine protease
MSTMRAMRAPLSLAAAAFWVFAGASRPASAEPRAEGAGGNVPDFAFDTADAPSEIAGEIAVDVRDDASDAEVRDIASRYGIALRPNSAWSQAHDKLEVADVEAASEAAVIDALSHDPRVEGAEPMALYRATFVPNDPLFASKQWHLSRVGAEQAWNYGCGEGVTVAVVDTGIACFDKGPFSRGTDLAGTRCTGGYNFVNDSPEAFDDQGHGTHVAGTIAQTTNNGMGTAGLAYCATLMPVKVLSRQGFGTVAGVAQGIRFAADNGAQVINLSLGGPIRSGILQRAIEHALDRGVVVVAAAGNTGRSVGYPAAYPGVIAVSATDANDVIAPFSSRGREIGLAAPGVAVTQQTVCNGGRDKCEIFGTFNGTSMASPHVAGAAAMIESLGVTRASAVRSALESTARAKEGMELYGAGILDVGAAMSHVYWRHLLGRVLALVAIAWVVGRRIRAKGGRMTRKPSAWAGAFVAGTGLLPLAPLFGGAGLAARFPRAIELVTRPLGEWDLALFGAGAHAWLLFASALPAMALTALAFRGKKTRPFIGGIALGTAAFLAQLLVWQETAFVLGSGLLGVWAVANGLVCIWIARIALVEGRSRST